MYLRVPPCTSVYLRVPPCTSVYLRVPCTCAPCTGSLVIAISYAHAVYQLLILLSTMCFPVCVCVCMPVNTMCFQTALDAVQVMQQAQVDADQWMAAWHQRQKDPKGKHLRTSRTKSARGEGSASQPQAESLLTPLQPVTSQILPAPLVSSTQQMSVCNSGWGWTPQDQA